VTNIKYCMSLVQGVDQILMNINNILTLVMISVGMMFVESCTTAHTNSRETSHLDNLELVATYEPLHIYVYVDTRSTNKHPDVTIFEGQFPILTRENRLNEVEVTHFDKGQDILHSLYDKEGRVLSRTVNFFDGHYDRQYTYIDTNGDGLFDFLIKGEHHPDVFTRSNLCWVPYSKTNSKRQE
jgi:hypothetical protein